MNSLLTIGASAVRAYQGALATVSSNIANAGVEGYARRDATLATGPLTGQGWPLLRAKSLGSGVFVDGVRRAYDQFLTADARTAGGQVAQYAIRDTWQTRLQNALGPNDTNVGTSLTAFFNAAQEVSTSPESTAARSQFLSQSDQLAAHFRRTAAALDDVGTGIKQDMAATTAKANALLTALFDVNQAIRRAAPASDLKAGLSDQRDKLLGDLSSIVGISIVEKNTGTVDVRLGDETGPLLLDLSEASSLSVEASNGQAQLFIVRNGTRMETALPTTGEIAGLTSAYHQTHVEQTRLDGLAQSVAGSLNAQHVAGTDWQGQRGQPLFDMTGVDVVAAAANRGQLVAQAQLGAGATATGDYRARYDAVTTQWTLQRADASAAISGASPLVLDGMSITLGGTPLDGDQVTITISTAARHMRAVISDPARVAAAAPWQASKVLTNTGTAQPSVAADGSTALPAASLYRFTVSAPGMVDIYDAASNTVLASVAYVDGEKIGGNGFSFTLSGTASVGDSFTVKPTPAASRDNDNMRELVRLRLPESQGFEQKFQAQRTRVAQSVQDIRLRREVADVTNTEATKARDAGSAVNLDEEAANLVRFQQAYQASARILTVAQDIFDSILQVT
jgi:flagellar hook-associated protein 1